MESPEYILLGFVNSLVWISKIKFLLPLHRNDSFLARLQSSAGKPQKTLETQCILPGDLPNSYPEHLCTRHTCYDR